jgi:hypothetical protein
LPIRTMIIQIPGPGEPVARTPTRLNKAFRSESH